MEVGDGVGAPVGGQSSEPGLRLMPVPNMLSVFTLALMFQHRYWLNEDASRNMLSTSVTAIVLHELKSWLNAEAPAKVESMSVTEEVLHEPIGWLNTVAPLNVLRMVVTDDVFQLVEGR